MALGRKTRSITRLAMVATVAIGLAASLAVGCAVISSNDRIAQLAFVKKASESLQAIETRVASANDALFTLRDLLDATDRPLTVSEFQFFADRLRQRVDGLRDTGWAPRVARADREAFEAFVRLSGVPNYRIWERDNSGQPVPPPERDVYFPILYPDPAAVAPKVLGVNVIFEPMRERAVLHAIETRKPATTPPLQLVSGKGMIDGFMTFLPVFGKDGTTGEPRGVVFGVFEIAPLIENALAAALPADIGVYLYNPAKPAARQLIHWHPAGGHSDLAAPARQNLLAGPHWESTLHMADQTWGVVFVPDRVDAFRRLAPGLIPFAIGLLITAMIEAYLVVSMRRTLQLEHLTQELRATAKTLAERGEKLTYLARHDPLTGLRNRTGFAEDRFQFAAGDPDAARVAVLMLDLDRFKAVNDTLGHAAGDLLLCQVALRLRENVAEQDMVARLGGDEFVVVIDDLYSDEAAIDAAHKLLRGLDEPISIDDSRLSISASIGVAAYSTCGHTAGELIAAADAAMYVVKRNGGSGVKFGCDRKETAAAISENQGCQARSFMDQPHFAIPQSV
jgi:diguanylate cyclase (GGDEF)-like protein